MAIGLGQVFQVATEFRFEIGSALLGTNKLNSAVESLQNKIDDTSLAFQRMGLGLVSTLGLGSGGIVGLIYKAVQASDKFKDSQLGFANILSANRDKLIGPVDSFNQRMQVSADLLNTIVEQAKRFSLPQAPFVELSKLLSAQLISKGLAGKGLQVPIELARNFLKAAPTLGIDPSLATGQLLRTIEGGASGGDTLFRRLTAETSAFKPFVGEAKKFNELDPAKRLAVLVAGLRQFTADVDVLNARVNTFSGSFSNLIQAFSGLGSVLRPIGDLIVPQIVKVFKALTNIANNELSVVIKNMVKIVRPMVEDLEGTVLTFLQLRNLSADVKKTAIGASVVGAVQGIGEAIKFFTGKAIFAVPIIGQLAGAVYVLGTVMKRVHAPLASLGTILLALTGAGIIGIILAKFKVLGVVMAGLGTVISAVVQPLLIFFAVFQTISRAVAYAQVRDAKALPALLARLSGLFARLKAAISQIMAPLLAGFDFIAQKISFIFSRSFLIETTIGLFEDFIYVLEGFAWAVKSTVALITGLLLEVGAFLGRVQNGEFMAIFKDFGDAFLEGWSGVLMDENDPFKQNKRVVANQVTNVNGMKVEIRNDFKENLQPDRIAFTMKEQLMKVAQNPTQASRRSTGGILLSGRGATGSF